MSSTGGGSLAAQAARAYAYVILWMAIRHWAAVGADWGAAAGWDLAAAEEKG